MNEDNLPILSKGDKALLQSVGKQIKIVEKILSKSLVFVDIFHVPEDGSLKEAVRKVKSGGKVIIAAGEYSLLDTLTIDKSLVLEGAGHERTVIHCEFTPEEKGCVNVIADNFQASGFSVLVKKPVGGHVMRIKSKAFVLDACSFHCAVKPSDNLEIAGHLPAGAYVYGQSKGDINGCMFTNNHFGILVTGASSVLLEGNVCERNDKAGISFYGAAAGIVNKNVCCNNGGAGIGVTFTTHAELTGNRCESNDSGILFIKSPGSVKGNICRTNRCHGIYIIASETHLTENRCEKNTESGIKYSDESVGTVQENRCHDNYGNGILVHGSSPELVGNSCISNKDCGITVDYKSSPTLVNNWCSKNSIHGIAVGLKSTPVLIRNRCEKNEGSGIVFTE